MEGWSRSWSRRGSRRGSSSYGESESERESEANLAWGKLKKIWDKMGKDLRTVTKIEEKINDVSKRLTKLSKGKIWKRSKTPKQTVLELKEMESKLIGIKNRFSLLVSHSEIHGDGRVTNIDELRHKLNLIELIAAQITKLVETLGDNIGQSSTQQQFEEQPVELAPDLEQFQALNINANPDHGDDNDDDDDDYDTFVRKIDDFKAMVSTILADEPQIERKFMDVRALCDNLALGYVRSNMGLDYEFVDFASHLIPTFSRAYGDGLHFNFFARQKTAPSYYPAELFFVEVANGEPQTIIRCVPLLDQPYSLDDVDRPPECYVFHPDNEHCVYCEHAKDGSLERNFCLAPPLI